ncbi:MAG: ergothioneine biosynthesis protein EgtB [Bacteroidetes bacterium]|nr:ergothioneine biosynthesis protein EgtB [Bacteroidota bacterium]
MESNSPNTTLDTTQSLALRYREIRQKTLDLCQNLHAEDYVVQPVEFVSPPKWHLGHSTWFFENFILAPQANYSLFDERLNWFFNSYYESQGPRILRSKRGNMTRPTLEKVLEYRQWTDQHLLAYLEANESGLSEAEKHTLEVGLQHEQQHQELLLMDIKYILGNNPLFPAFANGHKKEQATSISNEKPLSFLNVEEGLYEIGYHGEGFCWDNERSPHKVWQEAFAISDRLITNGEYLAFIEAGGYENHQYWLSEGWEWQNTLEVKAPLYWYARSGQWYEYTLSGIEPLDPNKPVAHLSYYEADAYAQWKGLRLPTEFEWEIAAKKFGSKQTPGAFMDGGGFHPKPVSASGDHQFAGHLWEWTSSAYQPYPRYPRFKGALGEYNGKFMINQMVLRGGSAATPMDHFRITYRNFFHPNMRWQFSGFRLAKDLC